MAEDRITLTRTLDKGIYRSDQEAENGVVATFPLTRRGALKAERTYADTRKGDVLRWGNVGAGTLTLTYRGRDVTDELRNAAASGSRSWLDGLLADLGRYERKAP